MTTREDIAKAIRSVIRNARELGHVSKEAPTRRRPKRLAKKLAKRGGAKRADETLVYGEVTITAW